MSLDEEQAGAPAQPAVEGLATPAVRRARAWLSRALEPGSVAAWRFVERVGAVAAVRQIRCGEAPPGVLRLIGVRAAQDESVADLRAAERCGGRLVVPEDEEWPAYPLHSLVLAVAEEPDDPGRQTERTRSLVPPLAL